jgi:hypothetical protein
LVELARRLFRPAKRKERGVRIVADCRPLLLRPVLLIPPTRRAPRLGRALPMTVLDQLADGRRRPRLARRPRRIVALLPAPCGTVEGCATAPTAIGGAEN